MTNMTNPVGSPTNPCYGLFEEVDKAKQGRKEVITEVVHKRIKPPPLPPRGHEVPLTPHEKEKEAGPKSSLSPRGSKPLVISKIKKIHAERQNGKGDLLKRSKTFSKSDPHLEREIEEMRAEEKRAAAKHAVQQPPLQPVSNRKGKKLLRSHSFKAHDSLRIPRGSDKEYFNIPEAIKDEKEWEEGAWEQLELFAEKEIERGNCDADLIIDKFIHQEGLNTTTILKRLEIHKKMCKSKSLKFLDELIEIKDPRKFLRHVKKKLSSEQRHNLYVLIGGKEALGCLQLFKKKQILTNWYTYISRMPVLLERAAHIATNRIPCPVNFDKDYPMPISLIYRRDVIGTFRAFCMSDSAVVNTRLWINEIPITCLDLSDEPTKTMEARAPIFMEWIIGELNHALGNPGKKSIKDQVELLFREKVLDENVATNIKDGLRQAIKENTLTDGVDIPGVLQSLKDNKLVPKDFYLWAKKFLAARINEEIDLIVDRYAENSISKQCHKEIPCYPLLLGMTFNAFFWAQPRLQKEYCPELWSSERDDTHIRMKYFSYDETKFKIEIDAKNRAFTVTQIKPHHFVKGRTDSHEEYGDIEAHWSLHFDQGLFSGDFWCENLKLSPRQPLEDTIEICDQLRLPKSKKQK